MTVRSYTNDEIVAMLRRLADDIDRPGAYPWDEEGVLRTIRTRLACSCPIRFTEDDAYCNSCEADELMRLIASDPAVRDDDEEEGTTP